MRTVYDSNLNANLTLDDNNRVLSIDHRDQHYEMADVRGREAAETYLRDVSRTLTLKPSELNNLRQVVSYLNPREQGVEYHFSDEKPMFDTTTYTYYQTYLNVPVWASGVTVTVKQAPARVLASTNTSERGINARMPSGESIERFRQMFARGQKIDDRNMRANTEEREIADPAAAEVLGRITSDARGLSSVEPGQQAALHLIRGRFFVYRYDPRKRVSSHSHPEPLADDGGKSREFDEISLPPVPESIREGDWYLVAELIVSVPFNGRLVNWRLLMEVETQAILYLEALTSAVDGRVFQRDPITATGNAANAPSANNATLSAVSGLQTLVGLTAPPLGANQALTGNFVQISDFELTTAAPPTEAPGANFDYQARTNNFAAVNAYYHCDRFFRLVQDLGFTMSTYFDGTTFPVPVDHRGRYLSVDGIERNASCNGDGDGIANVDFELADLGDTTNPIGIAGDWRVVLHELGGHGILYDHVNSANFGFAHSAGDSLGVILNDPGTQAADRFESFPWVSFVNRRHDRPVPAWGWGGANDIGGYSSEQILATTLFRAYRSIGGDSADLSRQQFAARFMVYLILRAVGTLTPMSNPGSPAAFLNALTTADAGDWASEGYFGGAYKKVLQWAFEKQNLNAGAPPAVDVYIDDGRGGEYQFQPVHWANPSIWNRRNADGGLVHQEPALTETNYAYVKIKNRGTSIANNVVVKGYHCKPSAGVRWPTDFQAFTTPQLNAGTVNPNNTEEKIVGPFEWTPTSNVWGHDCMLVIVSATNDASNIDNFTAGESVEDWRLVPNDNNVGQRNVNPVPGGGGVQGLMAGLDGKGFFVGNPGRGSAKVSVSVALPPLLSKRGWRIDVVGLPESGRLKSGEQRLVTFKVHAGQGFTKRDAEGLSERDIVVNAALDGVDVGGMIYRIDPDLEMPFNHGREGVKNKGCLSILCRWLGCK
jgi:zinc metalloprotease ZmpB